MSEECYSDKAAASMENALEACRQERDKLRDGAKQIARALKALDDYLCKGVKHTVSVCGALATARELGLLED